MTGPGTTHSRMDGSYLSSRDFDYGVHDELRQALEHLRGQIAARIRQAAKVNPDMTRQDRHLYELAARIAEDAV
jgi:hypothetical protein